ncbi:hypothetical protein E2C01_055398 [Portunus trituberculatus]|uniref:Uncharacterized protein n=1 Tax=Portunus trituberculatus TaxID=210409 RepID=A0A5B7GWP7_PORTR|nr:hypothetical protein [Portunus trituberculatus]
MFSYDDVMRNTVADRTAIEAHTYPSPTDLATDQTDFLSDLKTACRQHRDTTMTDTLQRQWTKKIDGFADLFYAERLSRLIQDRLLRADLIMI